MSSYKKSALNSLGVTLNELEDLIAVSEEELHHFGSLLPLCPALDMWADALHTLKVAQSQLRLIKESHFHEAADSTPRPQVPLHECSPDGHQENLPESPSEAGSGIRNSPPF